MVFLRQSTKTTITHSINERILAASFWCLIPMDKKNFIWELFRALPADGSWMRGIGLHSRTLTILLDEGTPYIEEIVTPDEGTEVEWLVRFTARGLLELALLRDAATLNDISTTFLSVRSHEPQTTAAIEKYDYSPEFARSCSPGRP